MLLTGCFVAVLAASGSPGPVDPLILDRHGGLPKLNLIPTLDLKAASSDSSGGREYLESE